MIGEYLVDFDADNFIEEGFVEIDAPADNVPEKPSSPAATSSPGAAAEEAWLHAVTAQIMEKGPTWFTSEAASNPEPVIRELEAHDARRRRKLPCKGSQRVPVATVAPVAVPGTSRLDRLAEAQLKAVKGLDQRLSAIEGSPPRILPLPGWKTGCLAAAAVPVLMFMAVWGLGFLAMILEAVGRLK